jgi:protein-S-isoprenylcysteine O-methyltransferase Ste14
MNGLALFLYGVFAITAFGWRTWLQWRRTGDTGLRMHAKPGTIQWWAKLAFVAALLAGVAAPIAGLVGLDPIDILDSSGLQVLGTILAVAGIALTVAAQWQMGASWRIGVDPTERTGLVTGGVFGWVRNPIFTAMLITAVGFALIVGNVVAVIGLVALIVALEVQVRAVEEPYLTATHGPDYRSYAACAGRFIPGIGRLRPQ